MLKIKKERLFLLLLVSSLALTALVQAEPLVELEEGDNWTYTVIEQTSATSMNAEEKTATYEVVDIDYFGSGDTQIKLNDIKTNYSTYTPAFAGLVGTYNIYAWLGDLTGKMEIQLKSYVVTKQMATARGNIPFIYEGNMTAVFVFTELVFNGSKLPDYTLEATIPFTDSSSNPEITSSIATGAAYINTRYFSYSEVFRIDDFLGIHGGDSLISMNISLTERYEASNLFTYKNQDCRNITITPLQMSLDEFHIVTHPDIEIEITDEVTFSLPATQDWIFGYDTGLPLDIVIRPTIPSGMKFALLNDPTIRMELSSADLKNGKFDTGKADYSLIALPLMVIILIAVGYVTIKDR